MLTRLLIGVVLAWSLLAAATTRLRRVAGTSMAPTLEPDDVVLVIPLTGDPRVGTVVTLRDPRDERRMTMKRVVASAGARTDLAGEVLDVPDGHVAVRGDAVAASTDSRHYGPVPIEDLDGRVVARLWPRPRGLS